MSFNFHQEFIELNQPVQMECILARRATSVKEVPHTSLKEGVFRIQFSYSRSPNVIAALIDISMQKVKRTTKKSERRMTASLHSAGSLKWMGASVGGGCRLQSFKCCIFPIFQFLVDITFQGSSHTSLT